MTQQYILGEFSSLLAELQAVPGQWLSAVKELRREVESSPVAMLSPLAREAMDLSDTICWTALEQGDVNAFCCSATTAAALREFTANAGLLP